MYILFEEHQYESRQVEKVLKDIYVLQDVLVCYRQHKKQISMEHNERQFQCDRQIKRRQLNALLGSVTEDELDLHCTHYATFYPNAAISSEVEEWYSRLLKANNEKKIYNQRKLKRQIQKTKIPVLYQTFSRTNLSNARKLGIMLRHLPLCYFPEAIAKFHIWKKGG